MRIILHIDMDSFFTSCEVREKPELKGKSVVVGADPKQGAGRGVVSTASYEARKFGIRSAMPISQAYKLAPQSVFLPVNMDLYVSISESVMERLRKHSDFFEQVSIDEAYLDISAKVNGFEEASEFAAQIQKEIKEEEKLTCSIGVAPNKLIAKIASDFNKPAGMTIVHLESIQNFLSEMPIIKIPGIGPKTKEVLNSMGISSINELAAMRKEQLYLEFGKFGLYLHDCANGIDDDPVQESFGVKSISRNTTFESDTTDADFMKKVIEEQADEIFSSLKENKMVYKTAGIRVRYSDFETLTRAKSLQSYTDSKETLLQTAIQLLTEFIGEKKIRQVGLRVSNLKSVEGQRSISEFLK